MKIGCGTVLFRKFDLERSLEAIRRIGYEYFETQAVGPWCPHVNIETDDPENLVKLKNKFGFKGITGLWSYNGNIIRPENSVETVSRSIEWAAAAGIPIVHFGDGSKSEDMTDEAAKNSCGCKEIRCSHGIGAALDVFFDRSRAETDSDHRYSGGIGNQL